MKLLFLMETAADADAGVALAAEWKSATGVDAVWCRSATLALPQFTNGEILEIPPAPNAGGALWSALCRTLAAGSTPLLARPGTPGLGLAQLQQAQALLARHDAVFGVTSRGYALVGLARAVPELFAGIPAEADRVMAATRAQARRHRCNISELALALD